MGQSVSNLLITFKCVNKTTIYLSVVSLSFCLFSSICHFNLCCLTKEYSGSKKITDKLLKDLIKTVIKIGILYRNEQFTQEELNLADQFKKKFRTLAMTVISFHDLDFSFDKSYICSNLMDCSTMLKQLVENHLTEKSLGRIDNVFTYYGAPEFMEEVFKPTSHLRPTLTKLVEDLNKLLEEHVL